jgi:hypothetical protein
MNSDHLAPLLHCRCLLSACRLSLSTCGVCPLNESVRGLLKNVQHLYESAFHHLLHFMPVLLRSLHVLINIASVSRRCECVCTADVTDTQPQCSTLVCCEGLRLCLTTARTLYYYYYRSVPYNCNCSHFYSCSRNSATAHCKP